MDNERYSRMLRGGTVSTEGMQALASAKVLVLGCGALGSVAASYLCGAGVGTVGIADYDVVDVSNLPRQVFYTTDEVGMSKSTLLARHLRRLNPEADVQEYHCRVTQKLAPGLFDMFDVVVDASDNPATKMMTARVCRAVGVACITGGISGWQGQALTWRPGCVSFDKIYPDAEKGEYAPPGVMGPVAGVIGNIQALEAIKLITGEGEPLTDRLFTFDARSMKVNIISLAALR